MTAISFIALLIAAAAGGFSLGAWLATARDSPAPDPAPTPGSEDYCAVCPFNPNDDDKEE